MKTFNHRTKTHLLIYIFLVGALALSSACSFENLSGTKNISAAQPENQTPQTKGGAANAANQSESRETSETDATDAEGTFKLNNHRAGSEGYENSLIVEKAENGKMRVSFEGTFFYRANGAESFHEASAYGTLQVSGNVAKGKLTEEGSDNKCSIELNFTGEERVSLKSASCDLNVTPDGVYQKGAASTDNLDADVVENDRRRNSSDNDGDRPFIQYDQSGEANGIVNLMERDGERVGCEEDVMNYVGEVKKVDYVGDYVYEFTLESDNRRPQRIALALAAEDRLPFDDVRAIIRRGNHLEVTFIYCGNAGIATPTAIYKR